MTDYSCVLESYIIYDYALEGDDGKGFSLFGWIKKGIDWIIEKAKGLIEKIKGLFSKNKGESTSAAPAATSEPEPEPEGDDEEEPEEPDEEPESSSSNNGRTKVKVHIPRKPRKLSRSTEKPAPVKNKDDHGVGYLNRYEDQKRKAFQEHAEKRKQEEATIKANSTAPNKYIASMITQCNNATGAINKMGKSLLSTKMPTNASMALDIKSKTDHKYDAFDSTLNNYASKFDAFKEKLKELGDLKYKVSAKNAGIASQLEKNKKNLEELISKSKIIRDNMERRRQKALSVKVAKGFADSKKAYLQTLMNFKDLFINHARNWLGKNSYVISLLK
jgi:hypothetical protein